MYIMKIQYKKKSVKIKINTHIKINNFKQKNILELIKMKQNVMRNIAFFFSK